MAQISDNFRKAKNARANRVARRTGASAAGKASEALSPAAHAPGGLPTVSAAQPAVSHPINNMGSNWETQQPAAEYPASAEIVLTSSGKQKVVAVRVPANDNLCIIDWVSFTVHESTWSRVAGKTLISSDQYISFASYQLQKIFGFGISTKRDKGMNFYAESWILGDDFGNVCFGGQRETMMISLSGAGCNAALPGWEKRLHDFFTSLAVRPVITRIDLAHDDIEGKYLSVDWAEQQFFSGGYQFRQGGTPPDVQRVGNWHRPTGAGRTFTVGSRSSSKFCRFYEKGKKEGDKASAWCRVEVEYKSSALVIPFEVLLFPSGYFAAAYPCFAEFAQHDTPQRMQVKQQTAEININDSLDVTKRQFGKYIKVFRELYGDKGALDRIECSKEDYWPKRLKALTATAQTGGPFVHEGPGRVFPIPKLDTPTSRCPTGEYRRQSNGA